MLKTSEFFGKKGLARWFIGQVPLAQEKNKTDPNRWGDRVQVRVLGSDPADGGTLSDKDLHWALILKPTSQGNFNRGSVGILGGEWVVGIYLDDEKEQLMILGVIGRTDPKYHISLEDQKGLQSAQFRKTLTFWPGGNPAGAHRVAGGGSTPIGQATVTVPTVNDWYKAFPGVDPPD